MKILFASLVLGLGVALSAAGCASSGDAGGGGDAPAAKTEKCKKCGKDAECKDGCCAKCAEPAKKS